MKKTVKNNESFQDIEASRFLKENGVPMVRISFVECNTKKGPQITMRLHTRITEGDDKGYIATSDAIWPRAYALDQDLELLRSSSIKDLMLRFGQKTVPVLDENGEPVKDENGEVMTELAWGSPKWVAWFDGQDWHELLGAKVLFDDQSDVAPEEDEED